MASRYDGDIPAEWDRSDPAGNLVDLATGGRIRDVEHYGGWVRMGDGTAIRDSEHFMLMQQQRAAHGDVNADKPPDLSAEILLLFS